MDKTRSKLAAGNETLMTFPKRRKDGQMWPAVEGDEEKRLNSIFEPLRPLLPADDDRTLQESANNKEPLKLYMESLNTNLKKFAQYAKKEDNSIMPQQITEPVMPGGKFQYLRQSQIVGHEIVVYDGRVWLSVIMHQTKQCRYGSNPYFLTTIELHVFDMNQNGKQVKATVIAESLGRTYPMQTNIISWKDNIYYWKRHIEFEGSEKNGFKRISNAWRQLTRLNLTDYQESEVSGYRIEEGCERQSVLFLDWKDQNYIIYAYQTGTSDLQIRRFTDLITARQAAYKLIYQLYSDVLLVDVKKGERIWLTKNPQQKSLDIARKQNVLEPQCSRHSQTHNQKLVINTRACECEGQCELRFLKSQYICTYSTKFRDQAGHKQSDFYAEEEEDKHKKTLDLFSMADLGKTLKSYTYAGDIAGFGGIIERHIEETGDLANAPINFLLKFELYHGNEIETFDHSPMKNDFSNEHNYKRDEKYTGLFTGNLYCQEIEIEHQIYKYFVDWDGCVILALHNRAGMRPENIASIEAKIEDIIGSKGGQGIVRHRITSELNRYETDRRWRQWADFSGQFMNIMNQPNVIISSPFKSQYIYLGSKVLISTLFRPRRVGTKWERLETSNDLGELQQYVLTRKKASIRAIFSVNGTYHRVSAENFKVYGRRSNQQAIGVEIERDASDKAGMFFVENPEGGSYSRVWHKSGHLKGQAISKTHYAFSFYNGKYAFVVKEHEEITKMEEGKTIFPPASGSTALYLQEDEQGTFSFGTQQKIKDQYDITFETVTEGSFRSDYIPFIINKHTKGEFFLVFYNFSDPSKPFIVQKLLRGGELARVSNTYTRTETTIGTKYMICSIYQPFELTEYEFIQDTTGKEPPRIAISSLRTLIMSPKQQKVFPEPQLICIPYFSQYSQQIQGSQIIVLNKENGWKGKLAIHIEDSQSETSNLQYEGKLFKFGTSKIYPDDNLSNQEYFTLIESCIQSKIATGDLFDPTEIAVMLKAIHNTQKNLIPFDMETQILHDNEKLVQGALFSSQEILMGKSKASMYLQNPKSAIEEFEKSQGEFMPFKKPINPDRNFDQAGFDFNLYTVLDRAFSIGTDKVQSGVLVRLFSMVSRYDTKFILMKGLPQIIDMADPPTEITTFFKSGFEADENGPILSIEDPIADDRAPLESNEAFSHFTLFDVPDLNDLTNIIVDKLNQRKAEDDEKDYDGIKYDVQHCSVNFTTTILGNKLKILYNQIEEGDEDGPQTKFSHYYLSELIQNLQDTPPIFLGQACMNIIDLQNVEAHAYYMKLFKIYLWFFLFPFLLMHAFHESEQGAFGYWVQVVGITIGLATQCLFFAIECIQLASAGSIYKYISDDIWNLQEMLQFALYVVWYCIQMFGGIENPSKDTVWGTLLTQIVLVQSFLKVLFFLRLYEGLGSLVQMLMTTIQELLNFTIFLLISVTFFAFSFRILGVDFSDDDYPNVPQFVVTFMTTYRNSIGDIQAPTYSRWGDENQDIGRWGRDAIVGTIWGFWLFNSFINLIILLNFLIAVISQVYDQVIATQQFCSYKYKSDFNREYFIVMEYFNAVPEYRILVQTQDINLDNSEGPDASLGFVKSIKNQILATFEDIKVELAKNSTKQHSVLAMKVMEVKGSFQNEVKTVRKEIADVKSELSEMLKEVIDKLDKKPGQIPSSNESVRQSTIIVE